MGDDLPGLIERVTAQVGAPALIVGRQPARLALGATGDQRDLLGAHPGSLGRILHVAAVDDPQHARSGMRGFPGAQVEVEVEPHHLEALRARSRRDEDLTVANSLDRVLRSFEERDQVTQVLLVVDLNPHSRSRWSPGGGFSV